MYLFGYGVGRFWIEGLRTDQLQFFNGVAVSQVLAAVLVVVSAVLLVVGRKKVVPIEQNSRLIEINLLYLLKRRGYHLHY